MVIVGSKDIHEGGTGSHVESAKVLAEKMPNAELVLIEGGGMAICARCRTKAIRRSSIFLDVIDARDAHVHQARSVDQPA